MYIGYVAEIIKRMADGFEEACIRCMYDNSNIIHRAIYKQLSSGQDGEGELLDPNYDNDPFFNEDGEWKNNNDGYKAWKASIPLPDFLEGLKLAPRPYHVPNLFIDGTFYGKITVSRKGNVLDVDPGDGDGPAIVEKWGEKILKLGPAAVVYFNETYMVPAIEEFFKSCGYR